MNVASNFTDSLDECYCEELTELGRAESLFEVDISIINKINGPATDDEY